MDRITPSHINHLTNPFSFNPPLSSLQALLASGAGYIHRIIHMPESLMHTEHILRAWSLRSCT